MVPAEDVVARGIDVAIEAGRPFRGHQLLDAVIDRAR
jgi:hypothetical protein